MATKIIIPTLSDLLLNLESLRNRITKNDIAKGKKKIAMVRINTIIKIFNKTAKTVSFLIGIRLLQKAVNLFSVLDFIKH